MKERTSQEVYIYMIGECCLNSDEQLGNIYIQRFALAVVARHRELRPRLHKDQTVSKDESQITLPTTTEDLGTAYRVIFSIQM